MTVTIPADIDDTDNNIKNRKREQDGLTVVEPDLEIGLMSMELGERSVFSIPKSRSKDDSMGLENIYTLIALLMRLFFKEARASGYAMAQTDIARISILLVAMTSTQKRWSK